MGEDVTFRKIPQKYLLIFILLSTPGQIFLSNVTNLPVATIQLMQILNSIQIINKINPTKRITLLAF